MCTMWQFKTKNFVIKYSIEHEDFDPFHWEIEDAGECLTKINAGEWECFTACVSVILRTTGQELSTEYLSQCIYADPLDFLDHRGMNKRGHGSYFSQMVREACKNARIELKKIQSIKVN